MDRAERDDLLRDLADRYQEVSDILEDYGLPALSVDCDTEDCNLPDDHDIMVLYKTLREGVVILEDYMN